MAEEVAAKPVGTEAEEEWPEEKKPGALRTLWNSRELVLSLTQRDIRSRYKQSVLGITWALLQPLALMAIYTVVVSRILGVKTGSIPYPIFAYTALLPWTFHSQSLSTGTECLVSNFNLITKIYFLREAFPIAAVLGKTVDLALGVLVLIPLFVIYHVHVTWWALLVLPVLLMQGCLTLAIVFITSSLNLFYRDVRHVIPLLTSTWMYLSPIIYPLERVPAKYLGIYMLNPMAAFIDTYRKVALNGQAPSWDYVGLASAISIVLLVVGYRRFKKLEPLFAETI